MRAPVIDTPVVASPMRRGGAFLVDVLILTIIGFAVITAFGDAAVEPGHIDPVVLGVGMFVTATYHVFFLVTMSATLGKLALGVYVSNPAGERIRPDTAILRYLVYMVGQVLFVGMVVSLVMMLTDPKRRTLHDRVAGTLVVVGKPPGMDDGGDPLNRYRR